MNEHKYCYKCGGKIDKEAEICTKCGVRQPLVVTSKSRSNKKDRLTAGLLGLFLGGWGVHHFYLGNNNRGLLYLLVNTVGFFFTWMLFWIPNLIVAVVVIVESIVLLTMSDEEFNSKYQV